MLRAPAGVTAFILATVLSCWAASAPNPAGCASLVHNQRTSPGVDLRQASLSTSFNVCMLTQSNVHMLIQMHVCCCAAGKTTTIRALADLLPQVPVVAKDPFNSGWLGSAAAAATTAAAAAATVCLC
jgi:hypothetical protein